MTTPHPRHRRLPAVRRAAAVLALAVLLTVGLAAGRLGPVGAAVGLPNPCTPLVHLCASDVLSGLAQAIPGLAEAKRAVAQIGGVLAAAGQSVLAAGVAWFTGTVVSTARAVLAQPGAFLDTLTRPRLTAAAFLGPGGAYHTVASIGVLLLVGFIFLGVISGLISGEPGQALFRVVRDTPAAVLAILGFPWLVDQMIAAADGLCAATLPSGQVLHRLLDTKVFTGFESLGVGLPQLLLAVVAFTAAVLVFAELLVRTVLVHLLVALAPISFAGIVWPAARPAARKVVEFAAAGVLAKPAIYVALKVGLDLVGEFADSQVPAGAAWGSLLLGIAVVCVAAFAPYLVWRLLPHAEGFLVAQGVSRMPARAGMQVLQTAYWIDMIRSRPGGRGRTGPTGPPPAQPAAGLGPAGRLPVPPSRGGAAREPAPGGGEPGGATGVPGRVRPPAPSGSAAATSSAPAAEGRAGSAARADRSSAGWTRRPRGGSRPGGAGPGGWPS